MFFGRSKIEAFCRTLITGMVQEVATENKVLLEEHWDNRIQSLTNLEKSIQKNLDTQLATLQARVDKAVDQLVKLSTDITRGAGEVDEEAVKQVKANDQRRTELVAAQAKASDAHREMTRLHMKATEEHHRRQTEAIERIAKHLEPQVKLKKVTKRG